MTRITHAAIDSESSLIDQWRGTLEWHSLHLGHNEMASDRRARTLRLYAELVQETRSERSAGLHSGAARFTVFHPAMPHLSLRLNTFQPPGTTISRFPPLTTHTHTHTQYSQQEYKMLYLVSRSLKIGATWSHCA
jgi:hypothetical protein